MSTIGQAAEDGHGDARKPLPRAGEVAARSAEGEGAKTGSV
jgi:hypothetical protein